MMPRRIVGAGVAVSPTATALARSHDPVWGCLSRLPDLSPHPSPATGGRRQQSALQDFCERAGSSRSRLAPAPQLQGSSGKRLMNRGRDLACPSHGINRTAASTSSCQLNAQVRLSPSRGQTRVNLSGRTTLWAKRIRAPVSDASRHTPSARPFGGQVKRHGAHAFCLGDLRLLERSAADAIPAVTGFELFSALSIRNFPIPGGFFPNIICRLETRGAR